MSTHRYPILGLTSLACLLIASPHFVGRLKAAAALVSGARARVDLRARKVKAEDLIDRRHLEELEKSGFFGKLWESKT